MDVNHRRLDWLLPDWLEDVGAFGQSANEDMSTGSFTVFPFMTHSSHIYL